MKVVYGAWDSTIEAKVAAFLRARPQYQQFGQSHDDASGTVRLAQRQ